MSQVRGKNTSLEMLVRSALHVRGYRFRKHVKHLPGKPDIVFPTEKVAVFVDGDFWHGWRFPAWKAGLSEFWQDKIHKNRERDRRNSQKLRRSGWLVLRVWGHQVADDLDGVIHTITSAVIGRRSES